MRPRSTSILEHGHTHDHPHDPGDHDGHAHGHAHAHDHAHDHAHEPVRASRVLQLEEDLLARNSRVAEHNRGWFCGRGVRAVNLMSAPGSGKTSLLERTIRDLRRELALFVVEGDQATSRDGERIRAAGCPVVQINTGAGCHLDALMVQAALRKLKPAADSILLIENVGNLVCPSLFDLGETARVVIASVTEGDDKPLKYPHMFRKADLVVLNKIDLLPHVEFSCEAFLNALRRINSKATVIQLSVTRGDGLQEWYHWLTQLQCESGI